MSDYPEHDHDHDASQAQQSHEDHSDPKARSLAEWVTLAFSATVVLSILGLVTVLNIQSDEKPARVVASAQLDEIRHENDAYYVPVAVTNEGDRTAESVLVEAELVSDSQTETAEITFDFLAGGELMTGAFIFSEDPSQGELSVRPVSYLDP